MAISLKIAYSNQFPDFKANFNMIRTKSPNIICIYGFAIGYFNIVTCSKKLTSSLKRPIIDRLTIVVLKAIWR